MSRHEQFSSSGEFRSREAIVGLTASEDNRDDIERVCSRALAYNLGVVVVCPDEVVQTLPDVVEHPEITVVRTPSNDETERTPSERSRIQRVARERGVSRVILVEDTSVPVDFEQTLASADEYVTESIPRRASNTTRLVAIPAYNEEETVRDVVRAARKHVDDVVVIDDGSTDNTTREAWRGGADVVVHEQNKGYGAALQTAFTVAAERDAETLIILDGDGQHDPTDLPKLIETVETEQTNVAIGSRFVGDQSSDIPLYRRFGLVVVNVLTNVSLARVRSRSWIHDTQSGFRAYDQQAIEILSSVDSIGDDMGASLDILYQSTENGLSIAEYPIVVNYDTPAGNSQHPVTHGFSLIQTILSTTVQRYGPVVFLVPSVLLASLVVGYLALQSSVAVTTESGLSAPVVVVLAGLLLVTATVLIYGQARTSRQ